MQNSKLKIKIQNELTANLKKGDQITVSTLRMLLAAILNREKEKKYKEKIEGEAELTDEEIIEVISSEAKKRKEAICEFEKGEREDLVKKEKAELEILQQYLPEQLSEEELKKIIKEVINKVGAREVKDIGKTMAEIMPQVKGRAAGSDVSKIVRKLLVQDDRD